VEFFKFADVSTTEEVIQEKLTLDKQEEFVEEIHQFLEDLQTGLQSYLS
jgi:hypothetical protein